MLRIGQVLAEARSKMNLIKSYGNPDVVYSFPSSAVPPDVGKKETGRASVKAPSPTPSAASRSLTATVITRSCGSKAHLLVECPVLYYSYSNTDHQAEWEGSTLRMAWAAVGFTEWQQHLVLPGYEDRILLLPKGTKPYLMGNDTKRAMSSHGSCNNPNSSDGSDRSNQGCRGNNQNQGDQGNQGGGRGKQRGGYNPNANQNKGRGSGGRGNRYKPPQGNFPPPTSSSGQEQGNNLRANPSIFPSHHLNATLIVQDKGRTGPASELRAVGKAVLDTANYSEDFISFTMLEKLDATHLCYLALQAITVRSGLDGQCYLNNELCD